MYTFIVNPCARSSLGLRVWKEVKEYLEQEGIPYQVCLTRYKGHAKKYVRHITGDHQHHTLIAMGGDGTVNEILNGICDLDKVTLGYIPIGSSNDFARGLGLPNKPMEALHLILGENQTRPMNVGKIQYEGRTKRFAVSTGIGFDAAVCHCACTSKIKVILNKLHLGKLTYFAIGVKNILFDRPGNLKITFNGSTSYTFHKAYFAAGMNLRYEGGGFKFAPHADPFDDRLDIVVISGLPKLKLLLLLPTAFLGWHVHVKGVHVFRCKNASIQATKPLPIHTDGEPVSARYDVKMGCEKEHIQMILPK